MSTTILVYLNLTLVAVASLVYASYGNQDAEDDGRMHVVYISTVPENTTDATTIQSAVDAVEADWDCHVTTLHTTNDPRALARALKRAIVMAPDGISMPGGSDDSLILPFVTEAHRQGIPVTYHTTPLPEAQRRYGKAGAGFAGAQGESSGYALTGTALERLQIEPGSPVLLIGTEPQPTPGSKLHGALSLLRSRGIELEYLQAVPVPEGAGLPITDPRLSQRINEGALPRLIIWEAGAVGQLTELLSENRIQQNEVSVVTLVPLQDPLPILQSGYILLQAQERPFLSCYFSLVQLQLTYRYQLPGLEIPIGGV